VGEANNGEKKKREKRRDGENKEGGIERDLSDRMTSVSDKRHGSGEVERNSL